MALSNAEKQRRLREKKAHGLVHIRGWVTPQQADAIRAVMADAPVTYQPGSGTINPHPGSERRPDNHKKLSFRQKLDHKGAWTVWWGADELGTVYKHTIDGERPLTVWVAYRHGGHSSRHVTRQHAAEALLREYRGF